MPNWRAGSTAGAPNCSICVSVPSTPICSLDALDVGRDYAAAYARAKRRVGGVDFDDLIRATIDLLGQPGMGEWVRYKLDQVTEHILIDEAQDTNPEQWSIIRALADEFFAGLGAHDRAAADAVHGRRLQTGDLRLPGHPSDLFPGGRAAFRRAGRGCAGAGRGGASLRPAVADSQLPLDPAGTRVRRCRDRGDSGAGARHHRRARTACQRSGGAGHGHALAADHRRRQRGG